ncbi:hypothetical protein GF312_04360 [Candidatus Poribacteria bacterium]|nr:hypothetical protein [Candidatus Poribacteria bacterium]
MDYLKDYSMLTNGMPEKSKKILFEVISDRIYFLKKNIGEINSQLDERQKLKDELKSNIDYDMCRIQTEIYKLDIMPDMLKRTTLESRIMDLCKEKRDKELSFWQDKIELKKELRKIEKELRTAMLDLWIIRFLS